MIRAVVDTNVLFGGLTSKKGVCAQVVDAWVDHRFVPCISTTLALEYEEVSANKLNKRRRRYALGAMQALLSRAEFTPVWIRFRPLSSDPDDDMVIECALAARAVIVTLNRRHLSVAEKRLGIPVWSPTTLLGKQWVRGSK